MNTKITGTKQASEGWKMSTDTLWDLFARTGDIEYYLLYAKKAASAGEKKREDGKAGKDAAQ
jgi:hypothetical protein